MRTGSQYILKTAGYLCGYLNSPQSTLEPITLFFLVFSRGTISEETKRHEYIHFQQMLETFLIGFVILYYWDYLKGYIKYRHGKIAYHSIRAEQEAYHKASSEFYTNRRERWAWIWDYKV